MKPTDNPKKAPVAAVKPKPKAAAPKIPGTVPLRFSAILFNLIGAVVSVMFLTAFFQHHEPDQMNPANTHINSGYDWLLNSMLANNLQVIEDNPNKTTQQRYELKWGQGEISYVDKIRQATPDTATILLPPRKIMQDVGFKSIVDLPWITYFLYPRTMVYEDDKDKTPGYSKAAYLVSINGWGLDKAGYQGRPEAFMVLPIKK